ncbi:MAG: hypothetical protein OXT63_14740 [Gemmatimonadota bacterium]|nr:hypothetical protein [Gemmatimonadota bacterium]
MGQSGIRQATVAIFGLEDVTTGANVNPTNVSRDINVVLDVQSHDETITGIALTLNDETIQCRGTSADADLAGAAGQLEVKCLLQTATVDGECMGMQMPPKYANGDYNVGAFITTDEGKTRNVTATQPVTLKNSGFVDIVHAAGATSGVVKGQTFYGGPTDDENTNLIHACPVAYDGTVVGTLQLTAKQIETGDEEGTALDGAASFRTSGSATASRIRTRKDDEAPFTWTLLSGYNWWVEDVAGSTSVTNTEHWFINDGAILDPDGRDVGAKFRTDNENGMKGPFWFDFSAPRVNVDGDSEVYLRYHPSGGWNTAEIDDGDYISSGSSANLWVSMTEERGVGGLDPTIAVGDCSITANHDNKSSTAFDAAYEDVRNVSDLPEDDAVGPAGGDISDDGGLECYIAELQALEDAFGNARNIGSSSLDRIQSGNFGVDKTAPEVSDLEPDGSVVLSVNTVMFEAEDPDLETDEDGSGIGDVDGQRYCSGSWWRSNCTLPAEVTDGDGSITVGGLDDGSYDVRALVEDNATPANTGVASYSFTRDTKAPTFTAGSGPGAVSAGSSDRVTVTVSGSIRDANVIDEALLSVYANNGSTAVCAGEDPADKELDKSRVGRKDIENDSKRIDFEESFTIKRPTAGGAVEDLCFVLEVKDVAVDATGDDDGANTAQYAAGNFTINWGVGLTFADAASAGDAVSSLTMAEGATSEYFVALAAEPAADVTVTVSVDGSDKITLTGATDGEVELTFTTENWETGQSVTVTGADEAANADDPEDGANETATIKHSASGGGYSGISGSLPATVTDDDPTISVDVEELTEGEDAKKVTITVNLANKIPAADATPPGSPRTITVTWAAEDAAEATATAEDADDAAVTEVEIEIAAGSDSGTGSAYFTVTDDDNDDDGELEFTTSGNHVPATIKIVDDDDDS